MRFEIAARDVTVGVGALVKMLAEWWAWLVSALVGCCEACRYKVTRGGPPADAPEEAGFERLKELEMEV